MIDLTLAQLPLYMHAYWKPAFEIGVFWFAYYLLFVYIKDSGMIQALKGLTILVVMFAVAHVMEFKTIRWVLSHVFQLSILGFIIVFHPELRRGLTRIGQSPLFRIFVKEQKLLDELVKAMLSMSSQRIGSLVAIEREMSLKPYTETGTPLDAVLTAELLMTIFMPNTPFHDGGVIVQGGRVSAVGCLFPLSQSQTISKALGTRHRAAVGLSEETDALVIVVSEETGIISIMNKGKMVRDLDEKGLRDALNELYAPITEKDKRRRIRFRRATDKS